MSRDRRLGGKLGALDELEWLTDSQIVFLFPYSPFMPNSSFAFPGSDHATFSKDFDLCHLLTMRSVTTNRQASELEFFLRWRLVELWATSLKELETRESKRFHFLLISHDCVAFDLVKSEIENGSGRINKAIARQQCSISPLEKTHEEKFDFICDKSCYPDIARSTVMIYTRKNKTQTVPYKRHIYTT